MRNFIAFLTDQERDSSTNLYNYDARLYDPVIGRFISADSYLSPQLHKSTNRPTGFSTEEFIERYSDPQKLNRYSYARNNPLFYTDPTGLAEAKVITIITAWTADGDTREWARSGIAGKIYTNVSSWKQAAEIMSKGNIKAEQVNLSGHGSLGGVKFTRTTDARDNFNGAGATNPAHKESVDTIKANLSDNATITSWGCESGKNKNDMQKMSNELGATVRGFTDKVNPGPHVPSDSWIMKAITGQTREWVEVQPDNKPDPPQPLEEQLWLNR